jgi:hypothetical protein
VKYARGEFDGAAEAIGVERTGRDGIDGLLNGGSVVGPSGQEVDLCRNGGKSDAAGAVASERVVGNCGAVLIAVIYKAAIGAGMDPLAVVRMQSKSEEREQRWSEEQEGSGAKGFHTTIIRLRLPSGDFCKRAFSATSIASDFKLIHQRIYLRWTNPEV